MFGTKQAGSRFASAGRASAACQERPGAVTHQQVLYHRSAQGTSKSFGAVVTAIGLTAGWRALAVLMCCSMLSSMLTAVCRAPAEVFRSAEVLL
jgi:hypothetical protein